MIFVRSNPRLTPWATLYRASGAKRDQYKVWNRMGDWFGPSPCNISAAFGQLANMPTTEIPPANAAKPRNSLNRQRCIVKKD